MFYLYLQELRQKNLFIKNTLMSTDYELFLNNKEPLENGYIYKFRTKYISNSRKTLKDWQIVNCLKSKIDWEIVPAISRYGYERGKPELIKEICR